MDILILRHEAAPTTLKATTSSRNDHDGRYYTPSRPTTTGHIKEFVGGLAVVVVVCMCGRQSDSRQSDKVNFVRSRFQFVY